MKFLTVCEWNNPPGLFGSSICTIQKPPPAYFLCKLHNVNMNKKRPPKGGLFRHYARRSAGRVSNGRSCPCSIMYASQRSRKSLTSALPTLTARRRRIKYQNRPGSRLYFAMDTRTILASVMRFVLYVPSGPLV